MKMKAEAETIRLLEARVEALEGALETFHGCEDGRRERDCPVCAALSAPAPRPDATEKEATRG